MSSQAHLTLYRPDDWTGTLEQLTQLTRPGGGPGRSVLVHCPPTITGRAAAIDVLQCLGRPRAARDELATGREWALARAWLRASGTRRLILAGAWRASPQVLEHLCAIADAGVRVALLDSAEAPTDLDLAIGRSDELLEHVRSDRAALTGCQCPARIVELPAAMPLLPVATARTFLAAATAALEPEWQQQLHEHWRTTRHALSGHIQAPGARADSELLVELLLGARTANEALFALRCLQDCLHTAGRALHADAAALLALTDPWRGRSCSWCMGRPWPAGRDPLMQAVAALARSELSAAQIAGLTNEHVQSFPRVYRRTLPEHLQPAVRAALEYFDGWPQLTQVFLRVAIPRQHPEISGLLSTRPTALRRWIDQAQTLSDAPVARPAARTRLSTVSLDDLGAGAREGPDDAVLLHVSLRDLGEGADLDALLRALGWSSTRLTQASRTLAERLNHTGERLVQTPGRRLRILTVDHPGREQLRRAVVRGPDLSFDASRLHAVLRSQREPIPYARASSQSSEPVAQELLDSDLLVELPSDH